MATVVLISCMASNNSDDTTTRVTVAVSDSMKSSLNDIAYELSEPGDRVTSSEVVREAIADYVEKFETQPADCCPRQRGDINGAEIEIDEGAA